MKILFIHQNFPGQFKHLAPALCECGHEVSALTLSKKAVPAGVKVIPYKLGRVNGKDTHPWLIDSESKVIRAEAAYRAASELRDQGYTPDLIIAHPGWGESLFLKQVWPTAKLLAYCEYFYGAKGSEIDFDPEFPPGKDDACKVELKNINNLLHLSLMDQGLTPTRWQQTSHPIEAHSKLAVIHDGIDTELVKPNLDSWLQLERVRLSKDDEIITFVNRNLEPLRGFHVFMRALPELLKRRPNARVMIVGGDDVSYGAKPPEGKTWRQHFLNELEGQLDLSRIHFLGNVAYQHYLALLQVSTVHVYLTYPFILSWSLLEAMACGCAIVASKTAPVEEVIEDQKDGLLVDFFSKAALVDAIVELIENPKLRHQLGLAARQKIIANYDLKTHCLPQQIELMEGLMSK